MFERRTTVLIDIGLGNLVAKFTRSYVMCLFVIEHFWRTQRYVKLYARASLRPHGIKYFFQLSSGKSASMRQNWECQREFKSESCFCSAQKLAWMRQEGSFNVLPAAADESVAHMNVWVTDTWLLFPWVISILYYSLRYNDLIIRALHFSSSSEFVRERDLEIPQNVGDS